jgi:hypothetical protein
MRLSEIRSETKVLTIPFQAGDLKVVYRPNAFTADIADKMQKQAADTTTATDSFLDMVVGIIESWDLEDDAGEIVPIDKVRLRAEVPVPVFGRIFQEIQKDQTPTLEGKA